MKQIVFQKDCNLYNKKYKVGDIFKPKKKDMSTINSINEKGFIEPLTKNELLEINNSFNKSKKED